MPNPQVSHVELSTGDCIPLSFDLETGTPVEILLVGTDLQNVTQVDLDSGPEISWVVTGISASANSVHMVAYAFGQPGAASILFGIDGRIITRTAENSFELPLLD